MARRKPRRKRGLLLVPLLLFTQGQPPFEVVIEPLPSGAVPLSAHQRWKMTRDEDDARTYVMETIQSGRLMRVAPALFSRWEKQARVDPTVLEKVQKMDVRWNAVADYLDKVLQETS